MAIPVKLPVFEGPLDLLMHLIEKNKIDIYDIPIAEITDQYLEYVRQMDRQDLDVTSEFLVMAATLLDIKCRMLLPREKDEETGEEAGDPREELVRRLLEYKMYKYLSEELAVCREQAGVRYFRAQNLPKEVLNYRPPINYDELLKGTDLEGLQKVFGEVLRRKKSRRDPIRSGFGKIKREEISIDNKTLYIRAYLQAHPHTDFRALLESQESREEVIVTFLILLELMKTQKVHIVQDSIGGKILVEAGSLDSNPADSSEPAAANQPVAVDKPAAMDEPATVGEPATVEDGDFADDPEGAGLQFQGLEGRSEAYSEPAEVDQPVAVDKPAAMDEPVAVGEPAEVDEPAAMDEPATVEAGDSEHTSLPGLGFDTVENVNIQPTVTLPPAETAASASMPLTTFQRMEIISSSFDPAGFVSTGSDLNKSAYVVSAPDSEAPVELPGSADNSCVESGSDQSDSVESAPVSEAPVELPDSADNSCVESGSDQSDSVESASIPAKGHFSTHLWYGVSSCRAEIFHSYSGMVQHSKVRPPVKWMRMRMSRLWARRFF